MTLTKANELVRPREPSRARYPDDEGYVDRDGVRTFYEVYGKGEPTLLLMPTWTLVHSRIWKAQIPYLARHFRVVTFDGRGNGRSDRPQDPYAYGPDQYAKDALAVMDATGTDRAVTISGSAGEMWNLYLCSRHPDRAAGAVFICSLFPVTDEWPEWTRAQLLVKRDRYEGAERYNVHFIRENLAEFARWWAEECLPEPHSAKAIEYTVEWALESDGETIAHSLGPVEELGVETMADVFGAAREGFLAMARAVRCPALVLVGELDTVTPLSWSEALARETGAPLITVPGMGHSLGRKPVPVNLAIREFVESLPER